MIFHYYSPFERASRYPYISRVPTGEKNLCFVYQFVKDGNHYNISNLDTLHTVDYISGAPTNFPKYGDFPKTFIARSYGFDISISSWRANVLYDLPCIKLAETDVRKINCIEFEFHEHVYPIRVSIYEVYNPGNIIKIWARDSQSKWFPLWEGSPQIVPPTSRLFSPPLQSCNFKTNRLRLEFKHSVFDYTKLDAVMLIGTSELILPRNPAESLTDLFKRINCMYSRHEDDHNLTADYENAHLDITHLQNNFPDHCIICKSDVGKIFHKYHLGYKKASILFWKIYHIPDVQEILPITRRYLHRLLNYYYAKFMDKSKELSPFSTLPDEVILEILKHLDLKTLCRMNQVNRRFYNLTLDSRLYTRLNMRNISCPTYIQNIFCYFTPRCKYLQQLDVTLCNLSFPATFLQFLENCGRHLTHLRLRGCVGVDHDFVLKISEICKNLKVLDLPCYQEPEDNYLENLKNLKYLKLDSTIYMGVQSFCKMLQNKKWMRKLDVHVRFCPSMNLDSVAMELKKSCPDLEIINLEGNYVISQGINALTDRKNLRKKIEIQIVDDSLNILLFSCQLLEELHLYFPTILTDRNLKLLTECKNLKHLHLEDVDFETPDKFSIIIEQCPKLQKFCLLESNVSPNLIDQWKESHPHVLQTDFDTCWL
ncbi:F-box/LRR-repeat protein 4-like [Temnothorax nylanderi]|uniref:F-box/LRR-repeat protein 4-like n=1 Tax=Temnothorax nylanderi TaxID=102681 RepID=UPI003A84D9D6